jgi:hypothetical protein
MLTVVAGPGVHQQEVRLLISLLACAPVVWLLLALFVR